MPRVFEYCEWLDDDDDDAEAFRRQKIRQRRRHQALMKHPMCNDPDHPGCKYCMENTDNEEDLF